MITKEEMAIELLEKELAQQRFNNEHNLSIDQSVADKIAMLEKIKANRDELVEMVTEKNERIEVLETCISNIRERLRSKSVSLRAFKIMDEEISKTKAPLDVSRSI